MEVTMSSAKLARDGGREEQHASEETRFWWCRCCDGAVNWRRETCFCCGARKHADAEQLTREEVEHRARNREQVEEGLL